MDIRITPAALRGTVSAVPSKSDAHRKLICAALADGPSHLSTCGSSQDIRRTAECLTALGANIDLTPSEWTVDPISDTPKGPLLDCGESGSTLRFLLPVASALCDRCGFTGSGRLPERPLGPLVDEMEKHGAAFSSGRLPFRVTRMITGGLFTLPGEVSSQFISGLLLAAPLLQGDAEIHLSSALESAAYVDMTVAALALFGVNVIRTDYGFFVPDGQCYRSPGTLTVDGDWSSSAFWLAAGALGGQIACTGLDTSSAQGDRAIAEILKSMGARIEWMGTSGLQASSSPLHAWEIDASPIPDLVPVLAAAASVADGTTRIVNASRLRLKESDRLASTAAMLTALGANIMVTDDGFLIQGKDHLTGGTVSSAGDHRIAMAAAVAACACRSPVVITGAECVAKSYPDFWEDYRKLGGIADVV